MCLGWFLDEVARCNYADFGSSGGGAAYACVSVVFSCRFVVGSHEDVGYYLISCLGSSSADGVDVCSIGVAGLDVVPCRYMQLGRIMAACTAVDSRENGDACRVAFTRTGV